MNSCNLKIKNTDYQITLNNAYSINKLMGFLPYVSEDKLVDFLKYIEDMDYGKKYVCIDGNM